MLTTLLQKKRETDNIEIDHRVYCSGRGGVLALGGRDKCGVE